MHRGSRGLVAERGCRAAPGGVFSVREAAGEPFVRFQFGSARGRGGPGGSPARSGGRGRVHVAYTSRTRGSGRSRPTARTRGRGPIANKGHRSNIGADGCLSWPPHRGPGGSARIARFERESSGRRAPTYNENTEGPDRVHTRYR
jgi:hypothetical protein